MQPLNVTNQPLLGPHALKLIDQQGLLCLDHFLMDRLIRVEVQSKNRVHEELKIVRQIAQLLEHC
jgi:hypothetical protein